jgi:hypothetical protein
MYLREVGCENGNEFLHLREAGCKNENEFLDNRLLNCGILSPAQS